MTGTPPPGVCPFFRGDRVEFTHPKTGKVISGTVKSTNLSGDRISIDADDRQTYTWGWKNFRTSSTPPPPREYNPFRVGDRVEWDTKKGVELGTVKSVRGERITVDMDSDFAVTRGTFRCFRKTDKQRPKPTFIREDIPGMLDNYSVTKYSEMQVRKGHWEGHEGNGYTAKIAYDGKVFAEAHNPGDGSPSNIICKDLKMDAAFRAFLQLIWTANGGKMEDYMEDCVLDAWVFWYHVEKPRGKCWWQNVEESQKFSDECKAHRADRGETA